MDEEPEGYRLTFNLPEEAESWIGQHEAERLRRTLELKREFLSEIVIYRMDGGNLQTFHLQYRPEDLRRPRRRG